MSDRKPAPMAESQLDKFNEAARELGVDENDEESFTEMVRRVAVHRPKKDAEPEPERPE